MNRHIKRFMLKVTNLGLSVLVIGSVVNVLYTAAIAAAPDLMAPVVTFVGLQKETALNILAPLLGSSVGLTGMKFVMTAMKGQLMDTEQRAEDRLVENESKLQEFEAKVMSAIEQIVDGHNAQTDALKQTLAVQNKMLEFYQIDSNSKLDVSDNLISPEIKAQIIEWQNDLDNFNEEMKSYELKNIYKITEIINNIIQNDIVEEQEIDPRVTEIIGDNDEEII